MKVFVTGSTGYIGGAIVRALVNRDHEVHGLVRSEEKAALLSAMGGTPVRGDLADLPGLRKAAAGCDVVIHAGFGYGADAAQIDRRAGEVLLETAKRHGIAGFVYTSGVFVLGNTGNAAVAEDAPTEHPAKVSAWRAKVEPKIVEAATDGVATAVIRPGMVYGERRGLVSRFFQTAVEGGAAEYIGDGSNRWSLVHRDDCARLYAMVAEIKARGIYHAVDGSAVPVKELARAASEAAGKGGATRSMPLEEARQKMGPLADGLCLDQTVKTTRSAELGWEPEHPPFIESAAAVFAEWKG